MEDWFSRGLLRWYKKNKRDLPWRSVNDPYKIWLSEVILQQTQVAQGLAYYLKFIETFPKVQNLAQASENEVLKLWQGLGYYSRARNLHTAAKVISEEYKGRFPKEYEHIKKLKGVGDYTAAAIASFAFGLPHAVVDGNVYRLLSRLLAINTPIDSVAGKKEFANLAQNLLDDKNPALYNQAIMEFGSQFCKPANPDCHACIFVTKCEAHRLNEVVSFPKKSKKTMVSNRFLNYLVIVDKRGRIIVNKRKNKDIWQGLYEFVLIESKSSIDEKTLLEFAAKNKLISKENDLIRVTKEYRHILTHQRLHAKFYVIKTKKLHPVKFKTVNLKELESLAFSRLIERFLEDCDLKEIV